MSDAEFAPHGSRLAIASGERAELRDATSGALVGTLNHDNYVSSVEFSRDGRLVLVVSRDDAARVWDADTGDPIARLGPFPDGVASAAFAERDEIIVANGGAVRIYRCDACRPAEQLRELAKRRLQRRLTADERAAYG